MRKSFPGIVHPPLLLSFDGFVTFLDPLITLSTRAQVETKHRPGETTLDAARKILKQEGLLGLFDGVKSGILGIAVTNG